SEFGKGIHEATRRSTNEDKSTERIGGFLPLLSVFFVFLRVASWIPFPCLLFRVPLRNNGSMLPELSCQNPALIQDGRVALQPGFGAWTGETGAGKTLLLTALGLLLGERGSAEMLRTGSEELRITGRFELAEEPIRREVERILNGPVEDEQVILTRRVNRS